MTNIDSLITFHEKPNDPVQSLSTGPFQQLSELLANIHPKKDVLHGEIGEPKRGLPDFVKDTIKNLHFESWGKYPKVTGSDLFCQTVHNWLIKRYQLKNEPTIRPHHIIPLTGSREGLFQLGAYAIMRKKSLSNAKTPFILCGNPFYHVYKATAYMNGAHLIAYHTLKVHEQENNLATYLQTLSKDILENIAAIFLNNPDNPTGYIYHEDDLIQLAQLAKKYQFLIIADECYSEIYYDKPPTGMIEVAEKANALDDIIIVNSLSKRSGGPGLRSGFAVVGDSHLPSIKAIRSHMSAIHPASLLDVAIALWNDEIHVQQNRKHYSDLCDIAAHYLKNFSGFSVPMGGFFLWLKVEQGEKFTQNLFQETGIKVLPGRYMSLIDHTTCLSPGDSYVRLAMVADTDDFHKMMERMALYLHKNHI